MKKTNDSAIAELTKMGLDMTPKGAGHHIGKFFERKGITTPNASQKMGVSHESLLSLINGEPLSKNMATELEKHYELSQTLLFNLEAQYLA